MLNHIPVLGIAFGLALISLALLRKSEELKKISLGFLIVIALLAIPAYLTRDQAAEIAVSGVFSSVSNQEANSGI